jgi:hypothetical protein
MDELGDAQRAWEESLPGITPRAKQAGLVPAGGRSRILPRNPRYLRALRQAELAAWNASTSEKNVAVLHSRESVRVRSTGADKSENRLYLILTLMAVAALAAVVSGLVSRAEHWRDFVEFVRQLVG